MKPRWKDGRLDLGRLGVIHLVTNACCWWWEWWRGSRVIDIGDDRYGDQEDAQRAAVRWLRAALVQAARRIGT